MIAVFLLASCTEKEQARSRPDIPVRTAVAFQKDVPVEVSTIGTVEAYSTVNITSRVDGQIMAVHVQEGQMVKQGQLLFEIDDRPYTTTLEAARANLARDRIQLKKAKKDAKRYADLFKKDYVTKDQAEQAQINAEALEESIKSDQAAIDDAELNVNYCKIASPITGRAGSILVHEGNLVKANDTTQPLMVINRIQPVYVRFTVPEQRLAEVRARLTSSEPNVKVYPPGNRDMTRLGRLTFMDNTIDPETGTIGLKAEFENADNTLWPGQFVNVMLLLGVDSGAVVVPSAAVQMGQQGNYLFVVEKDHTVKFRNVTPGARMDGLTVIEKGVSAGETVVTDGQLRLSPGARVVEKTDVPAAGEAGQ